MAQWTLQTVGGDISTAAVQLVDANGNVSESLDMTGDVAALVANLIVGDQITFMGDVAD